MTRFDKVRKEIFDILKISPIAEESAHAKNVLRWVLKLKPKADEALKISGLSHDIERAITKITEKDLEAKEQNYSEFKQKHADRSAKIITDILKKYNYNKKIIDKVKSLVENHEVGGFGDAGILKNADSLAYFEYNIPFYLKRNGRENTKKKINFMYKRMSEKSKKIIKSIKYRDKKISKLIKESI